MPNSSLSKRRHSCKTSHSWKQALLTTNATNLVAHCSGRKEWGHCGSPDLVGLQLPSSLTIGHSSWCWWELIWVRELLTRWASGRSRWTNSVQIGCSVFGYAFVSLLYWYDRFQMIHMIFLHDKSGHFGKIWRKFGKIWRSLENYVSTVITKRKQSKQHLLDIKGYFSI